MSEEVKFVPYDVARKIVGEIVDEEHLHEPDRRVLTVYGVNGKEICWFDTEELMGELDIKKMDKDKAKEVAVEYVFNHIPVWAVEDMVKALEKNAG
ncbi:MAG: hypothetical protein KKG47_12340 [Proteobacteria bacterium]|nr:hypothetical protein [Pseudomonadota bacterium]MBU1737731.1 hypothetical protein [Pseudomonadota bacterium]